MSVISGNQASARIAQNGDLHSVKRDRVPAFDAKPWLEDLEQTRMAIVTRYANLEWVMFEREIDLAGLFAQTKSRLQSVSNDSDARAVIDQLARRLGDGHPRFRWSKVQNIGTAANAKDGPHRVGIRAAEKPPEAVACAPKAGTARQTATPADRLGSTYGAKWL